MCRIYTLCVLLKCACMPIIAVLSTQFAHNFLSNIHVCVRDSFSRFVYWSEIVSVELVQSKIKDNTQAAHVLRSLLPALTLSSAVSIDSRPWVRHTRYRDNHKSHRHTLTYLALPCTLGRSIGGELSFAWLHVYCLRDFGILSSEHIYGYWRPVAFNSFTFCFCIHEHVFSVEHIRLAESCSQYWTYSLYPFTSLFHFKFIRHKLGGLLTIILLLLQRRLCSRFHWNASTEFTVWITRNFNLLRFIYYNLFRLILLLIIGDFAILQPAKVATLRGNKTISEPKTPAWYRWPALNVWKKGTWKPMWSVVLSDHGKRHFPWNSCNSD